MKRRFNKQNIIDLIPEVINQVINNNNKNTVKEFMNSSYECEGGWGYNCDGQLYYDFYNHIIVKSFNMINSMTYIPGTSQARQYAHEGYIQDVRKYLKNIGF